jgi:uncharacterized protein YbaP (TraB family)
MFLLAALLTATAGCGAAVERAPLERVDIRETGKVFLWRAESPTRPDISLYLLGSIHVGKEDLYPLDPAVESAFTRSETLAVEADIDAVKRTELMGAINEIAVLPAGETLKHKVSPQTWDKLLAYLGEEGMSPLAFSRLRPWWAAMTIAMQRVLASGEVTASLGIDRHFLDRAAAKGKAVVEVESVEQQLRVMSSMPDDAQEHMLVETLEEGANPLEIMDEVEGIFEAWLAGDAAAMQQISLPDEDDPEAEWVIHEYIGVRRNRAMVERIEELLETHSSLFVVVGAAHLVGEQGLVALFEQRGYILTQLPKEAAADGSKGTGH